MILEYDNMIMVWVCFNADRMKENQTIFVFLLKFRPYVLQISMNYVSSFVRLSKILGTVRKQN